MRILIIGSGGREHALAWKLKSEGAHVFVAPGNGGTFADNVPLKDSDIPGLVAFAREQGVDLVVPGPELPLTLGVVDAMEAAGIACFGPSAACARLEGSKAFAKSMMNRAGVPTAACGVFHDYKAACDFVRSTGAPLVVKADGLAAGKGVVVAQSEAEALNALKEMFLDDRFGQAGKTVLIEEFLRGMEVSLLCLCDGETALPLPSAQDHKAVFDNDLGPNTGGMGAYSPAPLLPDDMLDELTDLTVRPILKVMAEDGTPFRGVLYAGLMMTPEGPKVLEYNVRFGDPECQPLIMRLESNLTSLLLASIKGELGSCRIRVKPQAALGVVLTGKGYPGDYARGMEIEGLEEAEQNGAKVFVAGAARQEGRLVSTGGRILCVTALGDDLAQAQRSAYEALARIRMADGHFRTDIGNKGL